MRAIKQAIDEAGGLQELARKCGVRYQAVQKWRRNGRIPAERVLAVESATDGRVSRYQLRPDIYPQAAA